MPAPHPPSKQRRGCGKMTRTVFGALFQLSSPFFLSHTYNVLKVLLRIWTQECCSWQSPAIGLAGVVTPSTVSYSVVRHHGKGPVDTYLLLLLPLISWQRSHLLRPSSSPPTHLSFLWYRASSLGPWMCRASSFPL